MYGHILPPLKIACARPLVSLAFSQLRSLNIAPRTWLQKLSFRGIRGQLFRQFAVAVSVAMLISALNAPALSPAQPELAGVFSTYAADTPQIYLDIDRDRAQVLGVSITDDFNIFGRTWQVNLQAGIPFRKRIDDIYRIYVRNNHGSMVPMRALADAKLVQGPQTVVRYNGYRAAIINGVRKPGYSSGQAGHRLRTYSTLARTTTPIGRRSIPNRLSFLEGTGFAESMQ